MASFSLSRSAVQHRFAKIPNVDLVQRTGPGHLGTNMDYAQLLARLFLGSHPRTTRDIDRLRLKVGITAVLNLQPDEDMRAVNLAWEPLEGHYRT